jgi:ABC-type cobalamin/Fe3+-siderophores transport system ATPase subunit
MPAGWIGDAQDRQLLLLDEPTTLLDRGCKAFCVIAGNWRAIYRLISNPATKTFTGPLDMARQPAVLEVLGRLHRQRQRTIVMVLHDVNQAARYAHHMVALAGGRVVRSGTPHEILIPEVLAQVFGIEAEVRIDSFTNAPYCIPLKRCK